MSRRKAKEPPSVRTVPVMIDAMKVGEATIGPSWVHVALDSQGFVDSLRAEGYRTTHIEVHVSKDHGDERVDGGRPWPPDGP